MSRARLKRIPNSGTTPIPSRKSNRTKSSLEHGHRLGIPYVIVRPGSVYGPGKVSITGRVGIGTFGVFLHLGGSNMIPFTYVDNCAEAIALVGLTEGGRWRGIQRRGRRSAFEPPVFASVQTAMWDISHQFMFLALSVTHSAICGSNIRTWSEGQLPPFLNRNKWHAYWKKTRYSNDKLKTRVGWMPKVPTAEGFRRYFESCREGGRHA